MSYRELISTGAGRTEIQGYLAGGEMHSTTIRIPDNLKEAASEEARLSGMSFSAYLRKCLVDRLTAEGVEG